MQKVQESKRDFDYRVNAIMQIRSSPALDLTSSTINQAAIVLLKHILL
jgi:hypothetical protein